MRLIHTIAFIVLVLVTALKSVTAQVLPENSKVKYDTNYIQIYKDELTTRTYISRKQSGFSLSDRLLKPWLNYKTNDNLLLGLGYTYSFLTMNLAFKLPVFNSDNEMYGPSKYVDLQTHTIFRSFIVDLYLQWHKGFYLSNPESVIPNWQSGQPNPVRGDIRSNIVGLNVQYLFNSRRYSYKASFVQNEFQRKSAGSPIVGMEGYWMLGMSDSLMISDNLYSPGFLGNIPFNQVDIVNIGVNGGYAYTFVWEERLYVSLSSVLGLSGGYNKVHHTNTSTTCCSGITLGVNNLTRISLGFNSNKYYVGLSYFRFSMSNMVGSQHDWISYSTGNIRVNFVRRFNLKRSIKILRPDLWIF